MNTKTKYIAQCLSLLYTGVSENQAKRILHCISKATGIEEMTLPAMRRTLFACSCICDGIQRIVCCPKCGEWSLTRSSVRAAAPRLTSETTWRSTGCSSAGTRSAVATLRSHATVIFTRRLRRLAATCRDACWDITSHR